MGRLVAAIDQGTTSTRCVLVDPSGAIVAMDHKLDPSLVALMVGLGIPLSFLTLVAWSNILAVL